jgi:hypothetical protein
MSGPTFKTGAIILAFAVTALVAAYFTSHPKKDDQRWSELPHLARVAAVSRRWHVQPLASRYQQRYDAAEKALLASGYLVKITVPVRSSRTRCLQIVGVITNTGWPNGASRWMLDYAKDEVQLTCRREDVSLWRESLKQYENP